MIDIHSHILPFLDDGPGDIDISLKMATSYVQSGFISVVATPHHIKGTRWEHSPAEICEAVANFQKQLDINSIPLKILTGMEIAISDNIFSGFDFNNLLPIAGSNYFLLEPPFNELNSIKWEKILDIFFNSGKGIILSHPERCFEFQKNRELIATLVKNGVLIQVNMGSLSGEFGKEALNTSYYMLEKDYIHFIASDSHSIKKRKPPSLTEIEKLIQELGYDKIKKLFYENHLNFLSL